MSPDETCASDDASVAIGGDANAAQISTTHAEADGGKVEIHNYYSGSKQPEPLAAPSPSATCRRG
jgi:hypothetical protein